MADESTTQDPRMPPAPPEEQSIVINHSLRRLDWSLVSEAVWSFFSAERGFCFTMRRFAVNPRAAFEAYLGAGRLQYSNPIKVVFFLSALTAFVMHQLPVAEVVQVGGEGEPSAEAQKTAAFARQNYNLLILATLPLSAAITRLFYLRRSYNFIEHVALNAFQVSVITLAYLVLLPLILIWPSVIYSYMAVSLVYQTWLYRRVLGPGSFRAISTTGLVNVVYFLVITTLAALLGPIFG